MPAAIPIVLGASAVAGAVMNKHSSDSAARSQRDAAAAANATQQDMYGQTRQDLSGYRDSGNQALQQLMGYYGMGPKGSNVDYQKILSGLPGYQFQMQSGTKAVDQNLAARGLLQSGAAGKALTQYGQGLGQSYGDRYASGLAGIAGLGEQASAQTGAFGQQTANNVGYGQMAQGQASANGAYGAGNAWNQGLQGVVGSYGMYQGMGGFPGGGQPSSVYNTGGVSSQQWNDPNPWPISQQLP